MSITVKTGLNAPKGFIESVFEIDKKTYSPELCGKIENLYKRYDFNKDSFLLLYDEDKLIGYINFLTISDKLYDEMNDPAFFKMRDDDIDPSELEEWRKDKPNNIFFISIVVTPEYRKGEAIKLLGNSLLRYFRLKDEMGYKIGSISGSAISEGGEKFLKRFRASFVKTLEGGYRYYFAGEKEIESLIKNGILLKNYKDDIYFFIPMESKDKELTESLLRDSIIIPDYVKKEENGNNENCPDQSQSESEEDAFLSAWEKESDAYKDTALDFDDSDGIGVIYHHALINNLKYECKNERLINDLKRRYLGEFSLMCYNDKYTCLDEAGKIEKIGETPAHIFVTLDRMTELYIITVICANDESVPTQLIDQMSTGHLDIKDERNGKIRNLTEYMESEFSLKLCGDPKCVVCLSEHPKKESELLYMLSGETSISEQVDYKIRNERFDDLLTDKSKYDYYEAYYSKSAVVYVFNDFSDSVSERIQNEASMLFVVEIVLFKNSSILRANNMVIDAISEDRRLTTKEIKEIYSKFGKTMDFQKPDIFKYPLAQKEAEEVEKAFEISKTISDYKFNHQLLDRNIELNNIIASAKSEQSMSLLLFLMSCTSTCSTTLSAIMWALSRVAGDVDNYKELKDIVGIAWVLSFITTCLILYMVFKGIISKKKKKSDKKKRNKQK